MDKKKNLGQFYTKNSSYIIKDLIEVFPKESVIIDPFCGDWDLLKLVDREHFVIGYDIDPKSEKVNKQNTLLEVPCYENKWVITNPPYLARNKSDDKKLFDLYKLDDLYKISMKTLEEVEGGVLIVPLNFFSNDDIAFRKWFLTRFQVEKVYVFEEPVFEDTTYNVCSFSFRKGVAEKVIFETIPSNETIEIFLNEETDFTIGNEIFHLPQSKVKIRRILIGEEKQGKHLFINALDKRQEKIKIEVKDIYFGKNTDRCFASVELDKEFNEEQLSKIAEVANERLNFYRKKYGSLFLTNYRDFGRKRISFELAYLFIRHAIYLLFST